MRVCVVVCVRECTWVCVRVCEHVIILEKERDNIGRVERVEGVRERKADSWVMHSKKFNSTLA